MTNGEVAQHLLKQIIQVAAGSQFLQIGSVLRFFGGRIDAMIMRVIKEAALDLPNLMKHLPPLGAWVYAHFHLGQIQFASVGFLGFDRRVSGNNNESWYWSGGRWRRLGLVMRDLQQHLLAVEGKIESRDVIGELLRFLRLQYETSQRLAAFCTESSPALQQVERAFLARRQAGVSARRQRKRGGAIFQMRQIDLH